MPSDAIARLKQAWRGEVQARAIYLLLAARMGETRRGEIIRAIADAEARHRERIEARLRELGQPVPDASAVKLSLMQRLQARLAPVEAMIARMEAAEELEINDRYKRSTGDPATDAVLQEIRIDEQAHSRSLESMEVAHQAGDRPNPQMVLAVFDKVADAVADEPLSRGVLRPPISVESAQTGAG